MFHDLAESEPLETSVAFVSILHMRAVSELTFSVRVLTFRSIAANNAILAERALTVCSTLEILEVTIPTASLRDLDVVVRICESTREWKQNISELFELCVGRVERKSGTWQSFSGHHQ